MSDLGLSKSDLSTSRSEIEDCSSSTARVSKNGGGEVDRIVGRSIVLAVAIVLGLPIEDVDIVDIEAIVLPIVYYFLGECYRSCWKRTC